MFKLKKKKNKQIKKELKSTCEQKLKDKYFTLQ